MNELIPFSFEGAPVRVVAHDGNPWFVLVDVCRVLDMGNPSMAASRLDDDEKGGVSIVDPIGRPQNTTVINESGLYSLILTSRKPAAKAFKKWVTGTVLPEIRKSGGYMVAAPEETEAELLARAMGVLQATIERQKKELATAVKKVAELDEDSKALAGLVQREGAISMTAAAKVLQIKPSVFIQWLDRHGWTYRRKGGAAALGYSDKTDSGLLTHRVTQVTRPDGSEKIVEQVLITPTGLEKLIKIFKKPADLLSGVQNAK